MPLAESRPAKQRSSESVPTFVELLRNILVVLLLMALLSWLLSLVRVTLAIRTVRGRKEDIFSTLAAILKDREFKVREADSTKDRIVTEGFLNVIDIMLYGLIGNRVVFRLREMANEEVQVWVYGYASFLFIRIGLRKAEQAQLIDEGKVNAVLDELTKG